MTDDLETIDCLGRRVIMHHVNWERRVVRHPEIAPYRDRAADLLRDPDVVMRDDRTSAPFL